MSFITAFGTANPASRVSQGRIAEFMVKAMELDGKQARKLRTAFGASGIQYRYSVLDDYSKDNGFSFFPNSKDLEPFPGTARRMEMYRHNALSLSLKAIENAFAGSFNPDSISHLITVSCTGMYAPGLDIDIVNECGLSSSTNRLGLNFMGCYAAINAIRTADAICVSDVNARVLIVCTELCSLHFQKKYNEDNLLANALFGDGSAAMIVESSHTAMALRAVKFHSQVYKEGERDMAWNVGDLGFEMRLSSYVPRLISKGIKNLAEVCIGGSGLSVEDISYFAIHPGGKRILQVVEKELNISPQKAHHSHAVLSEYGNMSSPSVMFVLREIYNELGTQDHGKYVLSFAFGPGLTIEAALLRVEGR